MKATPPASSASKRSPRRPPASSSKDLEVIMERLRMYETAAATAKEKGEGSKARRYQRAIGNINTMAKQVGRVWSCDPINCCIALSCRWTTIGLF